MIRHAVLVRFDRLATTGRNRPMMVAIETGDGEEHEAYLKLAGLGEMNVEGLANEALAPCLARDLGVPITEPFLVDLDPDYIQSLTTLDPKAQAALQRSVPFGFASKAAGPGWKTWSKSDTVTPGRQQAALEILAFDALIDNDDRRPDNPNCLVKGNDLRAIDHDLTFGIRMKNWPPPEPWRVVNLHRIAAQNRHLFGAALKGRVLDLATIKNKWSGLNDVRLQAYGSMIPPEWASAATAVADAIDHLCRVRQRLDDCFAELERALT